MALASLLALVRRTRTKEEQAAYEKSPNSEIKNWLVPGASTYNTLKAYGRLHTDQNEAEQAQKKKASIDPDDSAYQRAKAIANGALSALAGPRSILDFDKGHSIKDLARDVVDGINLEQRAWRKQNARDMALPVLAGGAATAGTYGLTGLVPGLKDVKLLRWLLSGSAGTATALATYGAQK
jgi:hypothetical protein